MTALLISLLQLVFLAMASMPQALILRVEFQQQHNLPDTLQGPMTLRLSNHPTSLAELHEVLDRQLVAHLLDFRVDNRKMMKLNMTIEVYNQEKQRFVTLKEISQLGERRSRLSITLANADAVFPGHTCLALPSKSFTDIAGDNKIEIDGRVVFISEVANSGKGTGLTTWDGSVVLAKYLEHNRHSGIAGSRVVELGSGTGLVGIAAAILGANQVILSDLPYVVDNLAKNVAETVKLAARIGRPIESEVSVEVLDWFKPPTDLGDIDILLASDVVWVEELIPPLVATFDTLLRHSTAKTRILMSHQKRSNRSDRLFLIELNRYKLIRSRVPASNFHPDFFSDHIEVWEIVRAV